MGQQELRRWGQAKLLRSGQLVRELREKAGVTTNRMCAEIGMTHGQLSDIERGIIGVSLRRAHQMQAVLRVSVDEVVAQILIEKVEDAGFSDVTVQVTTARQCNLEITTGEE